MFGNPTMLAGIAGAVLPLVLHLLNRARYRNVQWGAMMFLGLDDAGQYRSSRLKELTLLALRMAMVAMLAVALARPVLGSLPGSQTSAAASSAVLVRQEQPSCTVIVMDRSGSMGYQQNGRPRIDAARRAVVAVLGSLRQGDEAALVVTPETFQPPQLTTDLQMLAARAAEMRWTSGRADLSAGLLAASRILSSSRSAHKQLIVVCDQQAVSWRDIDDAFAGAFRAALRGPDGQMPRFCVIPIGGDGAGNVAIESVRIANPPVIQDVPAEIDIVLRSFDDQPRTGLPLTIWHSGQPIARDLVSVAPHASTTARCAITIPGSGSTIVSARLGAGGMPADDSMDCALDVVPPLGVMVISGDESSGAIGGASRFLRAALSPFEASARSGPDPATVQLVNSDDWPELDRSRHRVVIVANVPHFTLRQVRQLEQYVYGGGGLLIAPGNLAYIDDYNSQLWRDGAGVMPAQLDSPVVTGAGKSVSLSTLDTSHPLFGFLSPDDPQPRGITINRYLPAHPHAAARVLGRYSTGEPFMIEGTYGRGRVLLITTSLDAEWSNLPQTSFYLPMMQSAVRYLAAHGLADRNLSPGETAVAVIDDAIEPSATMNGPGFGSVPIELVRVSDGYEARFPDTARPGRYVLRIRTPGQEHPTRQIEFIVHPPRDESDLSGLSLRQWAHLQRTLGFERIEPQPQAISGMVARWRRRQELWPVLLVGVIVLAVMEMALARAWSSGKDEGARRKDET